MSDDELSANERRRCEDALDSILRDLTDRQAAERCEVEIERLAEISVTKKRKLKKRKLKQVIF